MKIDSTFICDITADRGDVAIRSAIIAIAHSLGVRAVVEGVETLEQLALLREAGCDEFQGFVLSRPLPAEAAASLFTREATRLAR